MRTIFKIGTEAQGTCIEVASLDELIPQVRHAINGINGAEMFTRVSKCDKGAISTARGLLGMESVRSQ